MMTVRSSGSGREAGRSDRRLLALLALTCLAATACGSRLGRGELEAANGALVRPVRSTSSLPDSSTVMESEASPPATSTPVAGQAISGVAAGGSQTASPARSQARAEEHTSELQSLT